MALRHSNRLQQLLAHTSRTFAIAIPLLPPAEKDDVALAYLLLRVADTIEDSPWSPAERVALLDDFAAALRNPTEIAGAELARRFADPHFTSNAYYRELADETPLLLATLVEIPVERRRTIAEHCERTVRGMQRFLRDAHDGESLVIHNEQDLRDYCYVVAGIVGELLTELFLLHRPELEAARSALSAEARYFGEALQLTNILKDAAEDRSEGRYFLGSPKLLPRAFELAAEDLRRGREYLQILAEHDAPPGYLAFAQFPIELAQATLDRVRVFGPGAKMTRADVQSVLQTILRDHRLPHDIVRTAE